MTTAGTLHQAPYAADRPRDLVVEHPLLAYFVLAFGMTWIYDVLVFALLDLPDMPWLMFAAFGPPAAAILVARIAEGRTAVRALLRRILFWRVGLRWYALIFAGIPLGGILSFVFLPDGTENLPDPALMIVPTLPLLIVLLSILGGGQEEPGWRGFALPRLQARFGPLVGTVLLGTAWGLWHLPLYIWVSDYNNSGTGFADISTAYFGFVVYGVFASVLMTWVFNRTQGSVLIAMLMHASLNATFSLSPETRLAAWVLTLVVMVLALFIVAVTRGQLGYRVMAPASRNSAAGK